MTKIWSILTYIFSYIMSYFPTALPVGMTEFTSWQDSILKLSKVPDNDSTRFAVAVMVLHLDSTTDRKSKRYFIRALNKSAANELANAVAMGLKEKQKAAYEAKIKADIAQGSNTQQGTPNGVVQESEVQKASG